MRSLLLALLALALPGPNASQPLAQEESLVAISYNVRFNNPADGQDAWPFRKERVASLIRFHAADVAGLQEVLFDQLEDLDALLPGYDRVGVGRDDGKQAGEFAPIFYRRDRLKLLAQGTFWLSSTPDDVASVGWDAALPRIVTWARFEDLAYERTFVHLNTHFDHQGEIARVESAKLLRKRLDRLAQGNPAIVTGDFNFEPGGAAYEALTTDGLADALKKTESLHHGPRGTWSTFTVGGEPIRRIDYLLVTPQVRVLRHGISTEQKAGRYPSDHLPVIGELVLE